MLDRCQCACNCPCMHDPNSPVCGACQFIIDIWGSESIHALPEVPKPPEPEGELLPAEEAAEHAAERLI